MSMSRDGIAPNASRLLWAGFMAILAAGIGFAIRGGILDNWKAEFGFTDAQLGGIGGAVFNGFCFGIILGGVIVDKIGYRTHYLNILHASWPAGLAIGSALGWLLGDKLHVSWRIQIAIYLVATLGYGLMFLGQHFPRSQAA